MASPSSQNPGAVFGGYYTLASFTLLDGQPCAVQLDINGNLKAILGGTGTTASQIQGNVATATADAGNPVKIGGLYKSTPLTLTDGQRTDLISDTRQNLKVTLVGSNGVTGCTMTNYADAFGSINALAVMNYPLVFNGTTSDRWRSAQGAVAANTGIGVAAVEEAGRTFSNVKTATTTTSKSGAGFLHTLTCNTPVASASITLFDNTVGSGATIATVTLPAALLGMGPYTATYDAAFSTGLTAVTVGTADWTWTFR